MRHVSLSFTVRTALVIPVAVTAVTGALAGAGPAAAATRGATAPACTDTWVGGASKVLWNLAQNWSTGKVPGPASDVCISDFVIVTANGPVSIHSLQLGEEATVVFAGTSSNPSHVTIGGALDNLGNVELDNSSLSAAHVDNGNGLESTGTSVLATPALQNSGSVDALAGRLTLADSFAQLSNGTLTGGEWQALANGTLVLPADITTLASGLVGLDAGSAIHDQAGQNALAGLTSIGSPATLALGSGGLALAGSLVSDGALDVGSYAGGATLSVGGTLTLQQGTMGMSSGSTLTARVVRVGHGSSLSAGGTINGNLVNDGSVGPASHLTVTGSYTQGPDGSLAAGFAPGLQVGGKATLAGALIVRQAPPPAPGTTGTALTFASLSGGFTSHNLGFNLIIRTQEIDVVAQIQVAAAPSAMAPGDAVTVTGGDFGLDTPVTIYLGKAGGTLLGTAQSTVYGAFSASGVIPAKTTAGTHRIVAIGSDGRQAQTTITVA